MWEFKAQKLRVCNPIGLEAKLRVTVPDISPNLMAHARVRQVRGQGQAKSQELSPTHRMM